MAYPYLCWCMSNRTLPKHASSNCARAKWAYTTLEHSITSQLTLVNQTGFCGSNVLQHCGDDLVWLSSRLPFSVTGRQPWKHKFYISLLNSSDILLSLDTKNTLLGLGNGFQLLVSNGTWTLCSFLGESFVRHPHSTPTSSPLCTSALWNHDIFLKLPRTSLHRFDIKSLCVLPWRQRVCILRLGVPQKGCEKMSLTDKLGIRTERWSMTVIQLQSLQMFLELILFGPICVDWRVFKCKHLNKK